jgi:large subunit ribosomal protein L23
MIMAGKPKRFGRTMGRRSAWKKAIVTLGDGETIEISPIEEPASEE